MKDKILLVGSNGSIGKLLYNNLKDRYDVYPLDITKNFLNYKKYKKINIKDNSKLEKIFKRNKFEIVLNASGSYEKDLYSLNNINTNIVGFINILKNSTKYNVNHLINFQSVMCYSNFNKQIIPDPRDSYTITKLNQDFYFKYCNYKRYNNLILASVVAQDVLSGPIPIFIKNIKENKICNYTNTYRDYIDSEDFIQLINKILITRKFGEYYVGSGKFIKTLSIINKIKSLLNLKYDKKPKLQKKKINDKTIIKLSIYKTCKDFNWYPKKNIIHILKNIINRNKINKRLFSHHF